MSKAIEQAKVIIDKGANHLRRAHFDDCQEVIEVLCELVNENKLLDHFKIEQIRLKRENKGLTDKLESANRVVDVAEDYMNHEQFEHALDALAAHKEREK